MNVNSQADSTPTSTPAPAAQGGENTSPAGDDSAQGTQDEGQEGQKPKRDPFQRAINRQTRKFYEERALRMAAERELERYRNGNSPEGAKPAAAAPDSDAEPEASDFKDQKEYLKALSRWTLRQERQAESQNESRDRAAASSKEQAEAFADREDEYREKSEGYDDAVDNLRDARIRFSTSALDLIQDIEQGPALLEKLGMDLKEAKRIAALSPVRQVAELTRLADKLPAAAPKPEEKKKSGAPDPVSPVRNRAGVEKSRDQLTDDEWAKRRMAEKAKK